MQRVYKLVKKYFTNMKLQQIQEEHALLAQRQGLLTAKGADKERQALFNAVVQLVRQKDTKELKQ